MNETHDHIEVPQDMFCRRVLVDYCGFDGVNCWADLLWFNIESNWERGDERRYWSLRILGFHFQGGYLWERPANEKGAKE